MGAYHLMNSELQARDFVQYSSQCEIRNVRGDQKYLQAICVRAYLCVAANQSMMRLRATQKQLFIHMVHNLDKHSVDLKSAFQEFGLGPRTRL
jgi:hypothetical protein